MRQKPREKRPPCEDAGWAARHTIAVIVIVVVLFILASMPPYVPRERGNEASAVGSMRTINTAEITYADTYKSGYSPSLAALAPPPGSAQPSASAAGLIDDVLARGVKNGYRLTYTPGQPDKDGHIGTYTVTARPLEFGKSGRRSYFTDQSGVIRVTEENRPATVKDPPLAG
jgi:type IV pilus assembly protein PilA